MGIEELNEQVTSNEESQVEEQGNQTDDPDELMLAELQEEVDEESKPAAEEETEVEPAAEAVEEPKEVQQGEGKTDPEGDDEAADQAAQMIPKGRFDKALDERNRYRAEADYWKGRAEAQQNQQTVEQAPKDEGPTVEEQIAELETQRDAVYKKADELELTFSEARKQEREIDRKIADLEASNQDEPAAEPEKPAPAPANDLYLAEQTQQLMDAHPYCAKISDLPDADAKWDFIESEASAAMKAAGTLLNQSDPASVLRFRTEVAKLADQYGPLWAGPLETQPEQQKPTNNGGDVKPSPTAKAREEKLKLADNHPPDLSQMGSSGDQVTYTDTQIEAMSEEEFDALPDAVKQRIAGDSFEV